MTSPEIHSSKHYISGNKNHNLLSTYLISYSKKELNNQQTKLRNRDPICEAKIAELAKNALELNVIKQKGTICHNNK